ncbi:diadenylate cyclase CdaA [Prevotella communis]|uniref:diadenylate cyclase CdaA n=1 Tax=Prevotella communis TaxID=2913614 RepID=UPI001EDA4EBA|nr:diadenylate cyclase CdaA [Prevotella communis]UKK67739.1 diadenylate cyclase CdaA [Prevotella communis]UKK70114.1 diadenylate cyclase CdaA [Prevotella communis]
MIEFGIKDIIDILLVAVILFYTYRVMRESRSLNIFVGIMIFILVWVFVSQVLEMKLLGTILDKLVSVGVIAIIVIFQEDIRKFLYNLGAHRRMRTLMRMFSPGYAEERNLAQRKKNVIPIVMAAIQMAKGKVGALIVVENNVPLDDIVETGDVIDAEVNQRLIENIFFKNSPLHDGAMIISNHRIKAAGCILPVSHDLDIPKELGLRHRAALGMSQESDALCVIVSEETGTISTAHNGLFHLRLSAEELEAELTELMK